ncbi:MAG: flagellar hook-basal body complex protein [Phycisphaerales bacterium]|nr:MAG: flagellar hook-basal body complex protein [Phycisphaerales bacterium]
MSLTSAMLVGFTGINSNSTTVDTVGDNLANLNTTAFKGQRTLFETLLYRTISEGEAPGDTGGGTLPHQVGLGSTVGSIQRNFQQGGLESTGFQSDLAVDGDGFFILQAGTGEHVYTRDGSFRLDATQTLVSANGAPVQVFAADQSGNIVEGILSNLVVPLGTASEAVPTTEVLMDGRLDSGTRVASAGAVVTSQALATSAGATATALTPLTDLVDANGLPLFADGDVLSVSGTKGGIAAEESTFTINTTGSTLSDFTSFLEAVLGINTDPTTGGNPGVEVSDGSEFTAGMLVVRSNFGEVNAVELDAGSITNTTGVVTSPFSFVTAEPAAGGGVTTSFNVFDSLGNPVDVRLRMALESKSQTGTTWRFYAESVDDSDLSPVLGTGTVTFDVNGQFVGAGGTDLAIDREGVGSASPATFTLDFSQLTGLASPDGTSELVMASQDGAPAGILTGYTIEADGIVTGTFSNQLTRVFGQIALATFPNNEGLVALSENTFTFGPNSGDVTVVAPQTEGAGAVRSAALEQSNVEIAREFINLITASTGISSASRVIRVADDLLQELLLIAR